MTYRISYPGTIAGSLRYWEVPAVLLHLRVLDIVGVSFALSDTLLKGDTIDW